MSAPRDDDGDVEWRRPWGLYAVAALIAVVIVAGALIKLTGDQGSPGAANSRSATTGAHGRSASGAGSTHSAATGTPTASDSVPDGTVRQVPSPTATTRRGTHPFVHGIPLTWRLVALSQAPPNESATLVSIYPGSGTIVRMPVPPLLTGGPVSLVVGPERVLIHPTDWEPGYEFDPDGLGTRFDGGRLGSGGAALPGPDPGQVWVQDAADDAVFHLLGLNGRRTGVHVRGPSDASWVRALPDGAGYLILETPDGAYDVRPGKSRRVTKGTVVAAGATHWLVRECPTARPCRLFVIDAKSRERHTVPSPCPVRPAAAPSGRISPDGRTAALVCGSTHDARVLYLLDLRSGAGTAVHLDAPDGPSSMVWAPRSRWLFIVDEHGDLQAIDRHGRGTKTLATGLPPLAQVAARPPAAASGR